LQTSEGGLYVNSAIGSLTDLKLEIFGVFLNSIHSEWRVKFETMLTDEEKDSIESLVVNRHQIVHCQNVGVSYVRVNEWYKNTKKVVQKVSIIMNSYNNADQQSVDTPRFVRQQVLVGLTMWRNASGRLWFDPMQGLLVVVNLPSYPPD
jgi:hypothetical protein